MISVLKPLARATIVRLAKSGVTISRTEGRGPAAHAPLREDEVAGLMSDLEKIYSGGTDFGVYKTPADVKKYLDDHRIAFYHEVVDVLGAAGVNLDGKSVLDVGTCSGYLLRIIDQKFSGTSLSGTDYYPDLVALASALVPTAKVFQASIDDLKAAPDTYDALFCTEVLEHIVDTETQIPALLELVNPGGVLIVTVPNGRFDTTPGHTSSDGTSYVGHVNFWSPQSWQFYIDRIAGGLRHQVGPLSVLFDGDALYAVIFKD